MLIFIMEMRSLTDPQVISFILLIMSCMTVCVLPVQYEHHCRSPAVCRPIPSALHQALLPSCVRSWAALLLPLTGPQLDYSDSLEQRHGASRESGAVRNQSELQWLINLIRHLCLVFWLRLMLIFMAPIHSTSYRKGMEWHMAFSFSIATQLVPIDAEASSIK